jgi:hypothetical protein
MSHDKAYAFLVFFGMIAYMWYQARTIENQRLRHRPKGDTLRLVGAAALLGLSFIGLIFVLPFVERALPWSIGALGVSATAVAFLWLCVLVVLGLFVSRKSGKASAKHVLRDALKIFGMALLVIAAMFVALFAGPKLGVPEPWNFWAVVAVFAFGLFVKNHFSVRRRQRTSSTL